MQFLSTGGGIFQINENISFHSSLVLKHKSYW